MDTVIIETDGALMDNLGHLTQEAFPNAEIEFVGPIQESVLPDGETVNFALAGASTYFTIVGGIGPTITGLKLIATYLVGAYSISTEKQVALMPTKIKYRGKERDIDINTPDADVALRLMVEVLEVEKLDSEHGR